jgi:DNA-binding HxlR family transcriptional regulator
MENETMAGYLDEIPAEVREAVSGLSSPQRWAVFLAIHRDERNFNELRRGLGISAEQLDNILRCLVTGGLVFREILSPAGIGEKKKTRYTIAPAGKKLVRCLLDEFSEGSRVPGQKTVYTGTPPPAVRRMMVSEAAGGDSPFTEVLYPDSATADDTRRVNPGVSRSRKNHAAIPGKKRRPVRTGKEIGTP